MLKLLLYWIKLIIKFETSTNRQNTWSNTMVTTYSSLKKDLYPFSTMKTPHFASKMRIFRTNIPTESPSTSRRSLSTSALRKSLPIISRQSSQLFPSQPGPTGAMTSMTCLKNSSLVTLEWTIWVDNLWTMTLTSNRNRELCLQRLRLRKKKNPF